MARTIEQTVTLAAPPEQLYSMYVDPALHAAITGQPVSISAEPGALFSAFGGALAGRVLQTIAGALIVQAWRSTHWPSEDIDSTLVVTFRAQGDQGRIDLVHVNVPEHDVDGVSEGWEKFYWTPWRAYIEKNSAR